MKTRFLAAVGFCLSFAGLAFADIGPRPVRPPRPIQPQVPLPPAPKVPTYPLVIEVSPNVAEAKLVIPRKLLGTMKGELQQEEANPTAIGGTPRLHTIIAGSALALALAFSGLWLVRRGQVSGRAFGLAAGAVLLLGIGAAVWADGIGPRPRPRPVVNPQPGVNNILVQVNPLLASPRMDNVVIEIVDKGDSVKLIISQDKITKALYQSLAQPKQPQPGIGIPKPVQRGVGPAIPSNQR